MKEIRKKETTDEQIGKTIEKNRNNIERP